MHRAIATKLHLRLNCLPSLGLIGFLACAVLPSGVSEASATDRGWMRRWMNVSVSHHPGSFSFILCWSFILVSVE